MNCFAYVVLWRAVGPLILILDACQRRDTASVSPGEESNQSVSCPSAMMHPPPVNTSNRHPSRQPTEFEDPDEFLPTTIGMATSCLRNKWGCLSRRGCSCRQCAQRYHFEPSRVHGQRGRGHCVLDTSVTARPQTSVHYPAGDADDHRCALTGRVPGYGGACACVCVRGEGC